MRSSSTRRYLLKTSAIAAFGHALGKGRVFYFRPGHETYPVFKQEAVLRILSNAVRWLA
jgi:trehalose utilization protein